MAACAKTEDCDCGYILEEVEWDYPCFRDYSKWLWQDECSGRLDTFLCHKDWPVQFKPGDYKCQPN